MTVSAVSEAGQTLSPTHLDPYICDRLAPPCVLPAKAPDEIFVVAPPPFPYVLDDLDELPGMEIGFEPLELDDELEEEPDDEPEPLLLPLPLLEDPLPLLLPLPLLEDPLPLLPPLLPLPLEPRPPPPRPPPPLGERATIAVFLEDSEDSMASMAGIVGARWGEES